MPGDPHDFSECVRPPGNMVHRHSGRHDVELSIIKRASGPVQNAKVDIVDPDTSCACLTDLIRIHVNARDVEVMTVGKADGGGAVAATDVQIVLIGFETDPVQQTPYQLTYPDAVSVAVDKGFLQYGHCHRVCSFRIR